MNDDETKAMKQACRPCNERTAWWRDVVFWTDSLVLLHLLFNVFLNRVSTADLWTFLYYLVIVAGIMRLLHGYPKAKKVVSNSYCGHCKGHFTMNMDGLNWVEEPFDEKLGYRTWKAQIYCPCCGVPTDTWKHGPVETEIPIKSQGVKT
jgi:hypothetical protein